jgi:hypothetical protein
VVVVDHPVEQAVAKRQTVWLRTRPQAWVAAGRDGGDTFMGQRVVLGELFVPVSDHDYRGARGALRIAVAVDAGFGMGHRADGVAPRCAYGGFVLS